MLDSTNDRLTMIAAESGVSVDDLQAYFYDDLPFLKHLIFERDNVYQEIENAILKSGEGIFYCLIYRNEERKRERMPTSIFTVTDYIRQLYRSIYEEATKHGYTASYRFNDYRLADQAYYERVMEKHPDAGMIYFLPYQTEAVQAATEHRQVPLLILDHSGEGDDQSFYSLGTDNQNSIKKMVNLLIAKGHRRIAHITGNINNRSAQERLEGYEMAMREAGLEGRREWIKYGNWQRECAELVTSQLLRLEEAPTAIVCANDVSALGAYAAIAKTGLRVPEDISVTGFDDIALAATSNPPMTTIHQPLAAMGQVAVNLMIDALEGGNPEKRQVFTDLTIVHRDSVAEPPTL